MKELLILIALILTILTVLIVVNGGLIMNKFLKKRYKRQMMKTPW